MRKINTKSFRRGTRTTAKQINRQIILNLVRDCQPTSRADLARRMGMPRGMVTPLVSELLTEGLIYEGARGHVSRGRRPTLLHLRTRDRLAVAIDVQFSSTSVMLSDFSGEQISLDTFRTPLLPDELLSELNDRIQRLLRMHAAAGSCEGIGLVVPGIVDRATGRLVTAPTLGWRDTDLRDALAALAGLPVHIERDAVACALAQMWLGPKATHGLDSFVYLTISDGVGTGLVVNGEVVRGSRNMAGEFGHMPLDLNGTLCLCGSRGCLEAYTSNAATVARYLNRELSSREAYTKLRETGVTVAGLIAKARDGDAPALHAIHETGRYLGVGLAGIINVLNPTRIIVGGELMAAWDLMSTIIYEAIAERTLTATAAATPITPEPMDSSAKLRGATALVLAPNFAAPQVA